MHLKEEYFGKYTKSFRDAVNLTLRQVENDSGVSDSYLSQVENGQRGIPSVNILKKLAPVYKKSYEEMFVAAGYLPSGSMLTGSHNDESSPSRIANAIPIDEGTIIMLPLYGKISAGILIITTEQIDEYIPMDTRFFNMNGYTKDDFFFLRIQGHSMEPTIADNYLEDATVKRVVASGEKIILSADNKDYPLMIYNSSECEIIGKVLKKIGSGAARHGDLGLP